MLQVSALPPFLHGAEERELANMNLMEAVKEESTKARQMLIDTFGEQRAALDTIKSEFKLFQASLVREHQSALEIERNRHADDLEDAKKARPARNHVASRSVQRALLTPQGQAQLTLSLR